MGAEQSLDQKELDLFVYSASIGDDEEFSKTLELGGSSFLNAKDR